MKLCCYEFQALSINKTRIQHINWAAWHSLHYIILSIHVSLQWWESKKQSKIAITLILGLSW